MAAIWLETPLEEPIGTQIDGDSVVGRSSAHLNVQIPYPNGTVGFHAACSIDARWVQSQILGFQVVEAGADVSYQAAYMALPDPSVFPALDDGNWRTVRLGIDWLNTLTPELAKGTSAWNTLALILTSMGLDNNTGLIDDWGTVGTTIAAAVSTVVADGMSRSGYENNGGLQGNTYVEWPQTDEQHEAAFEPILGGTYVLPFVYVDNGNATDRTELYWSVAVTGLGYRANSTACYLALAVLLLYVVLALSHTIWVLITQETSTAWSSLTDLLTLALMSRPPDSGFDNASAGIERFRTLQSPIRIRVPSDEALSGEATPPGGSTVQVSRGVEMIIGTDFSAEKHNAVVIQQKY